MPVQWHGGVYEYGFHAAAEHGDVAVAASAADVTAALVVVAGMLIEVWARDVVEFCWK